MNTDRKTVSVIIPTYNSWTTLQSCLLSIRRQTISVREIIVIDNASADDTSAKIKKFFPKVKLTTLPTNTGVTGGRNEGIRKASSSDYLLFFDHDMVADKNMIKELIKVFELDKKIGIVTPKIFYSDDKKRIWSAGTGINLWTGQIIFRGGSDIGQYESAEEVEVAPAVILVKRLVINHLKAFDDRYFATYEDTDFCFRAKKSGFKVFYAPKAKAFHKIPSDSRDEARRLLSRAYWVGRNRILFMKDFGNNFYVFLLFLPVFIIYYLRLALLHNRFSSWLKLIQGTVAGMMLISISKKYIFAGERPSLSDIEGQHLSKYKFALKFCKGKNVLEIGCGSGYGSEYLAENGAKLITAYDIDTAAINFAIKNTTHNNIKFIAGNVETLRVRDKYDVGLSFEVIEHLNNPQKLLELAKKSIKKKGYFILSTPNKSFSILDNGKPSNPYHVCEYYPHELKEILVKYFKSVNLYGVVLDNKDTSKKEKEMHKSLRWQIINYISNKRFIRKITNYLPEYPKRLISGESKLSFKTEDFQVLKDRVNDTTDIVAVCKL